MVLTGDEGGTLSDVELNAQAVAAMMVRGLLPDPLRRRWVRAEAWRPVDCDPWSEDTATTGSDVAKLALLRLLHLQGEARGAAVAGAGEAVVLLARSSVEACLLGLYSLHEAGVVAQLEAGYLKAMRDMLKYVVDDGLVSADVVDHSVAAMGGMGGGPGVWAIADRVNRTTRER